MKKHVAIEQLGGTIASAAAAIGVSYHAVYKWPDELTSRLADRVHAAIGRRATAKPAAPSVLTA